MDNAAVRVASRDEQQAVIDVLTLGFSTDPMARWSLVSAQQYLAVWPEIVRAFGARAFELGSAWLIADHAGAAMWLPPGVSPDMDRLGAIMDAHSPAHVKADAAGVFEQMHHYHPTGPHWYLPLIAVDPARQNQGHGSALLRAALARCDADRLPAYLESSNPRNVSLYRRHGFEALGQIQVGSSPLMTPMLRTPR